MYENFSIISNLNNWWVGAYEHARSSSRSVPIPKDWCLKGRLSYICVNMAFLSFALICHSCCICKVFLRLLLRHVFHCRVHANSWQLQSLHDLCLWFPKHWLWMLLRMLLTWWQSCEPITTRAKPRLSTRTSSGKYCDSAGEIGDTAKCTSQDLRFYAVVWLGIQFFWDVTLC